jgi:hypothetical protein
LAQARSKAPGPRVAKRGGHHCRGARHISDQYTGFSLVLRHISDQLPYSLPRTPSLSTSLLSPRVCMPTGMTRIVPQTACPRRKNPLSAVTPHARLHKSAIQNPLAMANAKGAQTPPRAGTDGGARVLLEVVHQLPQHVPLERGGAVRAEDVLGVELLREGLHEPLVRVVLAVVLPLDQQRDPGRGPCRASRRRTPRLGFGRIVPSEAEVPII